MGTQGGTGRRWLRLLPWAVLAVLIATWSTNAHVSIDRPNNDAVDVLLGQPDPQASILEDHLAWALRVINGAELTAEDFNGRFSEMFRSQLSQAFLQEQLDVIAAGAPWQFYGFDIVEVEAQRAALAMIDDRDGGTVDSFVLTLDAVEPDQIGGLWVSEGVPASGPFEDDEFALHLIAGLVLLAGAIVCMALNRQRASLVLVVTAVIWLAQLLELSDNRVLYTLGLLAGPLAVVALAVGLIGVASRGSWTTASRAAVGIVIGAGLASLLPLTAIDTGDLSLPDQLLSLGHDRDRATDLVVFSHWCVVVAALVVFLYLLIRQFRADWNRERGLVATTFGGLTAAALIAIPATSAATNLGLFDLSLTPMASVAAMAAAVGLVATAMWEHYDVGDVASQLAEENLGLHEELAAQLVEVQASRARIVQAGENARREIERDLHDGAQQRLLAILLSLQSGRQQFGADDKELDRYLDGLALDLGAALTELRELARGLHPAILERGVLAAAESLAEASPIPVTVSGEAVRCTEPIEHAAYFVISEALTNAARHSAATHVAVEIRSVGDGIALSVVDDGIGGANAASGSGLQNLEDRVLALGGTWSLTSGAGTGTTVEVSLPCG